MLSKLSGEYWPSDSKVSVKYWWTKSYVGRHTSQPIHQLTIDRVSTNYQPIDQYTEWPMYRSRVPVYSNHYLQYLAIDTQSVNLTGSCDCQSIDELFLQVVTICFPAAALEVDCVFCCIHDFFLICSTNRAKNYKQQNNKDC